MDPELIGAIAGALVGYGVFSEEVGLKEKITGTFIVVIIAGVLVGVLEPSAGSGPVGEVKHTAETLAEIGEKYPKALEAFFGIGILAAIITVVNNVSKERKSRAAASAHVPQGVQKSSPQAQAEEPPVVRETAQEHASLPRSAAAHKELVGRLDVSLRRELLRYLASTSANRAQLIGGLTHRNPGIADLLVELEADDDLRSRFEMELLRSLEH